jgi:hypothetical protein
MNNIQMITMSNYKLRTTIKSADDLLTRDRELTREACVLLGMFLIAKELGYTALSQNTIDRLMGDGDTAKKGLEPLLEKGHIARAKS